MYKKHILCLTFLSSLGFSHSAIADLASVDLVKKRSESHLEAHGKVKELQKAIENASSFKELFDVFNDVDKGKYNTKKAKAHVLFSGYVVATSHDDNMKVGEKIVAYATTVDGESPYQKALKVNRNKDGKIQTFYIKTDMNGNAVNVRTTTAKNNLGEFTVMLKTEIDSTEFYAKVSDLRKD